MSEWITSNLRDDKASDQSKEQFIYKNRKKAFGPFKKSLWNLKVAEKEIILNQIESYLEPIFTKLNILNTKDVISPYFS